ncbi:hypothetical protein [Peribacillus simplex]|uniref:hypothetical protein n=1 Tax=Peribacillus simplex TaxID=1478 RepID=UPI003D2BAE10
MVLAKIKSVLRRVYGEYAEISSFSPISKGNSFVIGMIHAIVAYVSLSNLLGSNLFGYSVMVIGTYFLFQMLYYQITNRMYERAVINTIK